MARSRSRSPRRDRHRSRSRSRERDRDRERERRIRDRYRSRSRSPSPRRRRSRSPMRRRSRSRSWSPPRRRSRSGSRGRDGGKEVTRGAVPKFLMERPPITDKELEGKTDEEKEMMKMMGFGSFDTTKGKHVRGNNVYGVHVIHKRKYRQYMNRKGGFNRPLDFVA